ncbi:MAG: class I SAM-dependent methyltransferase [Alphaproteobacteria bacterium]|nr:class I SAM-dependent methyltransferase [Alphaproteobacteria bacterium]
MLFSLLLHRSVRRGDLTVIDAGGRSHHFGKGHQPRSVIRLHDPKLHHQLFFNPWLKIGEAYMDGTLTCEDGTTVYDLVDLGMANQSGLDSYPWLAALNRLYRAGRRANQYNPIGRSRRNVARHYDLSRRLFELFLDPSLQYSCAYFEHPGQPLAEAQRAKMRHIAAKLRLASGQRVLDIGSGWGGLALHLAEAADVEVLGVTLSTEQLAAARERAKRAGLADRVRFELMDYRQLDCRFDRIVSVGMFEHVGIRHYPEFFNKVGALLEPDGVALLHSIGRRDGPGFTNPWVNKYIFPGGYSPALSEVLPPVERSGLAVTDIEILRLHYAETLKAWRQNVQTNREEIRRLYDDRFLRMWEFYLVASELTFRHGFNMVFQMQLTHDIAAVPLTRDYMGQSKKGQAANDTQKLRAAS